ncbi:MAG: arylsulfatase A-like enzyme [Akkermansiaceae bacterium]|jgi:arylsulfatase A-like enzyme
MEGFTLTFTPKTAKGDNICVIWIDDLIDVFTWRDTFGLRIETPNIDRLSAAGTRFSNAYATIPLCAPCRAELATGMSPFRTGLVDLNRIWRDALPPTSGWQFDLRRAGFRNFQTGKVDGNYKPMNEDFKRLLFHDEWKCSDKGHRLNVKDYLGRGPGVRGVNHPNDDGSQDNQFYDFDVTENAIKYLSQADPARRHLMQLGYKHPHYNLESPDRFYQMYDPAKIVWPSIAAPEDFFGPQKGFAVYEAAYIANGNWTPERAGDEAWRQVVRGYFAAISHVDHEIGRFLDALRQSPMAQNTTVILLSDNGFNLGNHDSFHKMSQWDSAAHVPLTIWNARMKQGQVVDLPVSLHNIPKTVFDLAGLPPRHHWKSGQSLLPLIDQKFGTYDRKKSPVTSVFGTLSVRPSVEGLSQYRYFRYPNGEEHVYDLVVDPGETINLKDTSPVAELRRELVDGALNLGLDLRGFENPADGVNAMMAVDGTVLLEGGAGDNDYWAYGNDVERIKEDKHGGNDTLWYMGGPNNYVVHVPANIEKFRIGTVVARPESEPGVSRDTVPGRTIHVVSHPESPIHFETSERVAVNVKGSRGNDMMIGSKYAKANFYGGAGDDQLIALSVNKARNQFYGGAGNDTLIGGRGKDLLDGGPGNDLIQGNSNANTLIGGAGNDRIFDGPGGSHIHTGPGHNKVVSAGGDDHIFVGNGQNEISAGAGDVNFAVEYGGVTTIKKWRSSYVLDLSAWPGKPNLKLTADGAQISLGLSFIFIYGINDLEVLKLAITQSDPKLKQ